MINLPLSIIIPYFNSRKDFPRMLDSIARQPFKNYEIIVADGHSDEPCDDIVCPYMDLGMHIKVIRSSRRQYPLASRLAGFRISRGRLIYFVDSDDELIGEDSLGTHVRMALDNNCDILNFRSIHRTTDENGFREEESPDVGLGASLEGNKIFSTYVRTPTSYPNLWSKIYSRSLVSAVADLPILNHPDFFGAEDRLFNTIAMFYARSYVSSSMVGYKYYYTPERPAVWAPKAIPSYVVMLEEMLPFLKKMGANEDDLKYTRNKLLSQLTYYIAALVEFYVDDCGEAVNEETLEKILQFSTPEAMLKGLILGNSSWGMSDSKRELSKLQTGNIK